MDERVAKLISGLGHWAGYGRQNEALAELASVDCRTILDTALEIVARDGSDWPMKNIACVMEARGQEGFVALSWLMEGRSIGVAAPLVQTFIGLAEKYGVTLGYWLRRLALHPDKEVRQALLDCLTPDLVAKLAEG